MKPCNNDVPKWLKSEVVITFIGEDKKGVRYPHDKLLVVTPIIGESHVKKVLVDIGASVDILFYDAFVGMEYHNSQLTPCALLMYEFDGERSKIEGTIYLPPTIRQKPRQAIRMLNFMVLKTTSSYNSILQRTSLHAFKAVIFTYHLKMKFPTTNGVGEHRGCQNTIRS